MIKEFDGIALTEDWAKLIESGATYFYSEGKSILNYQVHEEICVINSVSLIDGKFPKKLLKDAINLQKVYKNVIISSTALSMKPYLLRKGFTYNDKIKAYERGIKWE